MEKVEVIKNDEEAGSGAGQQEGSVPPKSDKSKSAQATTEDGFMAKMTDLWKKKPAIIIGGGIGVFVVLILIIVVVSSGGSRPTKIEKTPNLKPDTTPATPPPVDEGGSDSNETVSSGNKTDLPAIISVQDG